jgi:hypothetical protein
MPQTSRELVRRALTFDYPERLPRELWYLPWAQRHVKAGLDRLVAAYPSDFAGAPSGYQPSPRVRGDMFDVGTYVDDWGCIWENIQYGVVGEVKEPILADLRDWRSVKPPYETLPADPTAARDGINRFCGSTDKFVRSGCCPRPWERYQFLRGSQNAFLDVMDPDQGTRDLLRLIHEFYLQELAFWCTTDVDALMFMDDWGAQSQLLVPPRVWRDLFKPLYREYCEQAHAAGKFVFMHSDGHIQEVYPDLVEIGVDALNSQLFCMDMSALAKTAKGKLTFWGEIDRQHVLPAANPQVGRTAVRQAAHHLYDRAGGIIAQFELSPGANPDVAMAIFDEWEAVHREAQSQAS